MAHNIIILNTTNKIYCFTTGNIITFYLHLSFDWPETLMMDVCSIIVEHLQAPARHVSELNALDFITFSDWKLYPAFSLASKWNFYFNFLVW